MILVLYHYKNKTIKITNLLVSIVASNSGNCNLIGRTGYYDKYTCTCTNYNPIIANSIPYKCTKKQNKLNHFEFPNLLCGSNMRY